MMTEEEKIEYRHDSKGRPVSYIEMEIASPDLCIYDERNPDFWYDEDVYAEEEYKALGKNCSCDNCVYGRARLADIVLKLQEELLDAKCEIDSYREEYENDQ